MPRVKRTRIGGIQSFVGRSPGIRSFMNDLFAYSSRQKRVYAAHAVVTLCRFGRWLSWALFPAYRFLPAWTDQVDGAMSWEMRAQITLRPNPNLPLLMGIPMGAALFARAKRGT